MKHALLIIAVAALAAGPAAAGGWRDEPVEVNVENLQPHLAQKVEKHAAEGYRSLARYLERTRMIHGLSIADVTQPKRSVEPIDRPYREIRKHAIEWRANGSAS